MGILNNERLKKVASIFLVVSLIFSLVSPTFAAVSINNGDFSDVSGMTNAGGGWYHGNPNHWSANGTNQYVINNNVLNLDHVGTFTQNIGTVVNGGEKITINFQYGDKWNGGYYAANEDMITAELWDITTNTLLASKTVKNVATYGTMTSTSFSNNSPATVGNTVEIRFTGLLGTGINPGRAAALDNVSVSVADGASPIITLSGSTPVDVEFGSVYSDAGATASDNVDGDITANIITVNPVNTNVLGSYTVTYNVSDAAGNAATEVTRTVNVVDTTIPVITLLGSATTSVNFGATYTDAGATASDNVDGDITGSIVVNNPVDTNTIGNYTVTYDVTDAQGNAATQVTRSVDVVDVTAPVITILGDNPMDVEIGGTYTELGANAVDDVDGTFAATPSGTVDTNTLGTYTISYDAMDSSNNTATTVTRTVNVVDTTAPVLTLLGITPTDTEWKQVYTDAGATASDNVDGDITANIITVNPVNSLVIGVYTITYNVVDNAGNAATEITRTVNVVDTTAPVAPTVQRPSQNETIDTATSNAEGQCETDATVTISGAALETNPTTTTCVAGAFATPITFKSTALDTSFVLSFTQTDLSGNTSPSVDYDIRYVSKGTSSGGSGPANIDSITPAPSENTSTPTTENTPENNTPTTPEPTTPENNTPTETPTESDNTPTPSENTSTPTTENTPENNTPTTPEQGTPTENPTPTGGTGGGASAGGTTTPAFNPADATLDVGGGNSPEEEVVPEETLNPADATLDVGGGNAVEEETSYTLLWTLLGLIALLNTWWFFVSKNKSLPVHRRD